MRKTTGLLLFLAALLLLPYMPGRAAGDLPAVTLAVSAKAINGGLPLTVTVTSDTPAAADMDILIAAADGSDYTVVIPGGESSGALEIVTPVVTKKSTYTYEIKAAEDYTAGKPSKVTVTLYVLPKVEFYNPVNVCYIGRQNSVNTTLKNRTSLIKEGLFELRNSEGTVLSTATLKAGGTRISFRFTPDMTLKGKQDLSVWWNGLDVSTQSAYAAFSDQHQKIYARFDMEQKYIALTLDCAYVWNYVDVFLDMLERHDVKGTFFMTGFGAIDHPEEVLSIFNHGHELGNHSYWHHHMPKLKSLSTIRYELRQTNDVIEGITGVRPTLFRPPFGEYSKEITAISRAEGCEVVMWGNSAGDSGSEGWSADQLYKHIVRRPTPGNIILSHISNLRTAEAWDKAIVYFKDLGYTFVTVSELAALAAAEAGN